MTSPEDCRRQFPDDPQIADGVRLLRRIPPWHFVRDDNAGCVRPSSAAFVDDQDGDPMSVYRQDVIEDEGGVPGRVLANHPGFGLVSLSAGQVRSRDQTVHADPVPEESSHGIVCGPKSKSTRKWFAHQAQWAVAPPSVT